MSLRQLDPKETSITWSTPLLGAVQLNGDLVEGVNLSIEKNNPAKWNVRQNQGLAMRSRNHNAGGRIRISYPKESPINKTLSALALADEATSVQVGILRVVELDGTETTCTDAFIETEPQHQHSTDGAVTNEWVFYSPMIRTVHNGNPLAT